MLKKKLSLFIVFVFIVRTFLFSEDVESVLFETYEKSTAYISQSIYFNEKEMNYPDVFKKVEAHYKIKLLNQYLSLGNGTGIVITKNGYIITNNHVIEIENEEKIKNLFIRDMIENLLSKIPVSEMTNEEYNRARDDLKTLVNKAKIVYNVKIDNKDDFEAKLVINDKEKDLSLLKIDGNNFTPAPLGDSNSLKVGNQVIAIGYPLQDEFTAYFKNFKSTMTMGVMSAIRKDDQLALQHTASINPGNSGGPLFIKSGEIVGINTALLRDSNNIYFSIPINNVKKWLTDNNKTSILSQNLSESIRLNSGLAEIGPTISFNTEKSFSVFINGEFKGKTPITLKNLKSGETRIRLESNEEFYEQKFTVNQNISDEKRLDPITRKYNQKANITSNVTAMVLIDDVSYGNTPININELDVGKHIVKVVSKGYFSFEKEINVAKNEPFKLNVDLEKGYNITFTDKLPSDAEIIFQNGNTKKIFKSNEDIILKPGKWQVQIKNPLIKEINNSIVVDKTDLNVDIKVEYIKAILFLKNLKKESKVIIDDEVVTNEIKDNKIGIKMGNHMIQIVTPNYSDYKVKKVVDSETPIDIIIPYPMKDEYIKSYFYGANTLVVFGAITSLGFVMFPIGLYYNQQCETLNYFSISASTTPSYDYQSYSTAYKKYQSDKQKTIGVFAAGLSLSIVSVCFFSASIPLYVYYRKLKKEDVKTSLFIDQGENLKAGILIKM